MPLASPHGLREVPATFQCYNGHTLSLKICGDPGNVGGRTAVAVVRIEEKPRRWVVKLKPPRLPPSRNKCRRNNLEEAFTLVDGSRVRGSNW